MPISSGSQHLHINAYENPLEFGYFNQAGYISTQHENLKTDRQQQHF